LARCCHWAIRLRQVASVFFWWLLSFFGGFCLFWLSVFFLVASVFFFLMMIFVLFCWLGSFFSSHLLSISRSISLSIYLSVDLFFYLSISLSIYLSPLSLSRALSLSLCLSLSLSLSESTISQPFEYLPAAVCIAIHLTLWPRNRMHTRTHAHTYSSGRRRCRPRGAEGEQVARCDSLCCDGLVCVVCMF
jgi:hypothetical protein